MIRFLLLVFAFSSCESHNTKTFSNIDILKDSRSTSSDQSANIFDKEAGQGKLYQYKNDSVDQKISIKHSGNDRIIFEYALRNNNSHCIDSLKGIAINLRPNADPELDEDDEGFGYPSSQYTYEDGGRYLAIRIALKTEDKVVIKASGFNSTGCNYESVGILRLINR